jgi:hypothetical protein
VAVNLIVEVAFAQAGRITGQPVDRLSGAKGIIAKHDAW